MNPRPGLSLDLHALEYEFAALGYALRGTGDAYMQNSSLVTMKLALEEIQQLAARISSLAGASAGRLADHLNRHAVAAE